MPFAEEGTAARRIEAATSSNVTYLDLSFLDLKSLPESLRQLTNLTTLHLGGNQLRELPDWLAQLSNLTWLSLGGNQLRVLPDWLAQLSNLTTLGLSDNQLRVLPGWLGQLTNLTWLHLGGNQLRVMPDSLAQLSNLTWLSIGGSQLRVLPNWLGQLPKLTTLHLYRNPLVSPPAEVVAQGTEAVLTFLRAGVRTGTGRQWRAKLLVVGEGGVGKTSLVKALTGQPHDAQEPTTHGLRIEELVVDHPLESGETMRLSVWDFGGQEIYHATHQFFLSAGCLAILVWSSRLGWEPGKLNYWLDLLHARAPGTPILLVASHTADRAGDLPLDVLRQKYPQIVGNIPVESPSGAGIEGVRNELAAQAAGLEVMGAPWPSSWLAAIEACRAASRIHVDVRELHQILDDAGVGEAAERETLARVMHRLGDILYYPDDQQLADTVILRPQWLSTRIAAILDSDAVANRGGLVTRSDLQREWAGIERGVRDHLLDLMDRFDISYRVTGASDDAVAIVVDRLPWNPPDYRHAWETAKNRAGGAEMRMRYQLGTAILPPGIPTWFIAREHRFTTGIAWRTGALLRHNDGQHLGLVTANQHTSGIVEVTVRGPWPASFLWLLDGGLNLTFARYPGLNIARQVPCPCQSGTHQPCPTWYDYLELSRRLAADVHTIECGSSFKQVDITALLSGIAPSATDVERSHHDHHLDLLDAINDHTKRILAAMAEGTRATAGELAQQSAAMDVGFTRIWNLLGAQYQNRCPRVFTLTPTRNPRLPGTHRYVLRLYCEEPGAWHPLPGDEGTYRVTELARWLGALNKHLTRVLALLTAAAPLAGPILGITALQLQGQLADDVTQMKELLADLPASLPLPEDQTSQIASSATTDWREPNIRAETDADFRAIAEFLHELDKHEHWGGLSRINTPEGRVLYVCSDHLNRYRLAPSSVSPHQDD